MGKTLRILPRIKARLSARKSNLLNQLELELDLCPDVRSQLEAALVDDCPLSARDGGFIRDGFHAQLDGLRQLATGGKEWIARLEESERQRTGIASLKVRYNKVFGYYLEISRANLHLAPPDYIRKQTLVNAERFITPDLKEYESRVLGAQEASVKREFELFQELRRRLASSDGRQHPGNSLRESASATTATGAFPASARPPATAVAAAASQPSASAKNSIL